MFLCTELFSWLPGCDYGSGQCQLTGWALNKEGFARRYKYYYLCNLPNKDYFCFCIRKE